MSRKRLNKKQLLTIAGVVGLLLLAVIAGVALQYWQQKQGTKTKTSESENAQQETAKLPKTVEEIQNLRGTGKDTEAKQKTEAALKDTSLSNDERYLLYIQQGFSFQAENNYAAAVDAYQKAAALKQNDDIYTLAGDASLKLGNKSQAVEFYKKAIAQVSQQDPRYYGKKENLEQKIKDAGGQP